MESPPKPASEIKALDFLIGKWHSSGNVLATPSSPAIAMTGTDTYEWALDGFFLLHRVEVMVGEEKTESIELIGGYDAANKTYPMRSFDNQGNFTVMQASIDQEGVMKIVGENMRSTLLVSKDGHQMTAHWEHSEDGITWVPWMEMHFSK